MSQHHFIRITGPETGWLYIPGEVRNVPAFINELVPTDYLPYSEGIKVLHPITHDQYTAIYVMASYGLDPADLIQSVLYDVLGGENA